MNHEWMSDKKLIRLSLGILAAALVTWAILLTVAAYIITRLVQ